MKIELSYKKKMILVAILSTIGIVIFSTITDMILYNHDVPKIDYKSFLGNDYWLYLLIGVFMIISVLSFMIASYELVKNILQSRGVKQHG